MAWQIDARACWQGDARACAHLAHLCATLWGGSFARTRREIRWRRAPLIAALRIGRAALERGAYTPRAL